MSEHTQGEWRLEEDHAENSVSVFGGEQEKEVCVVMAESDSLSEEDFANARLISAAPGLLKAADRADCSCSIRDRMSGHLVGCWMPELNDAIKKAKGEA